MDRQAQLPFTVTEKKAVQHKFKAKATCKFICTDQKIWLQSSLLDEQIVISSLLKQNIIRCKASQSLKWGKHCIKIIVCFLKKRNTTEVKALDGICKCGQFRAEGQKTWKWFFATLRMSAWSSVLSSSKPRVSNITSCGRVTKQDYLVLANLARILESKHQKRTKTWDVIFQDIGVTDNLSMLLCLYMLSFIKGYTVLVSEYHKAEL